VLEGQDEDGEDAEDDNTQYDMKTENSKPNDIRFVTCLILNSHRQEQEKEKE